jgi:hypothetical protein
MLETCTGPEYLINWIKIASLWLFSLYWLVIYDTSVVINADLWTATTEFSVHRLGLSVPCDLWTESEGTKVTKCLHVRWPAGAQGATKTTQIFAKSCSAKTSIVRDRPLSAGWALKTTCVYVLVPGNVKVGLQCSPNSSSYWSHSKYTSRYKYTGVRRITTFRATTDRIYDMIRYIYIYIYINRSWVDTRWQQYITHLHTNSTHNTEIRK